MALPPRTSCEPARFHSQQFRMFYESVPTFMSLEESALAGALQQWLFFVFNTDKQGSGAVSMGHRALEVLPDRTTWLLDERRGDGLAHSDSGV